MPKKSTAALCEPPLTMALYGSKRSLGALLSSGIHVMWAFSQAALVWGGFAAAKDGAAKATTRLKVRIETSAFMGCFLRLQGTKQASGKRHQVGGEMLLSVA